MKGESENNCENQNRRHFCSYVVCLADFFCCSCAFVVKVLLWLISGLWSTDRLGCGITLDDISALLYEPGFCVAFPANMDMI